MQVCPHPLFMIASIAYPAPRMAAPTIAPKTGTETPSAAAMGARLPVALAIATPEPATD